MKILMLSPGVWSIPAPRGTENHVYHLANELAALGCKVDLVSDIDQTAQFHENVSVYQVNIPRLRLYNYGFYGYFLREFIGGVFAFKRARRLLKNGYDVIHAYGKLAPYLLFHFNKFSKAYSIYTILDDPPVKGLPYYMIYRVGYKLLIITTARKADRTVSLYPSSKEQRVAIGITEQQIEVIPTGVDTNIFKPCTIKQGNYCLFVGSLTRRKGVDYLLQAVAKVDNLSCLIVGEGADEPSFVRLAESLDISNRVHFAGSIRDKDKLAKIYAASDFLVLPSLSEGLPVVILEAMACGKSVIVSRLPGPSAIIRDGYNGFLVEPGDVEGLAQKMTILNNSPDARREMGERALTLVRREFSWESVSKKTLELYLELARIGSKSEALVGIVH